MVECWCGAREDDGERMLSCYLCATWHHTRCIGLADDKETPSIFFVPGVVAPHSMLVRCSCSLCWRDE
jgi:PHD-finger